MDSTIKEGAPSWVTIIRKYNQPDTRKSIWQIINSLGPYLLLWGLMYYTLSISYWITLGVSVLAAGFLLRIFIIFHDCGHGSFFKSTRTSRIVGTILGALVFTPYDRWHRSHAAHHSTVGNLDKRGDGDVWTLTTEEYRSKTRGQQFFYRLYRHPMMLFVLGPVFLFTVWFRFNSKGASQKERWNSRLVNLIVLTWCVGLSLLMGWKAFLMIQVPIIFLATSAGSWLFYVQHQFEDVIWTHTDNWDYQEMALHGSSFLKTPRIIQWFSGNIGFHHIHHLGPKIPNYNLQRCHQENPIFSSVKPITIIKGLQTMKFRLWDENMGRLISFALFKKTTTN
jgi:omega-6 fatty acid desaturase (delta-12 desaturase)